MHKEKSKVKASVLEKDKITFSFGENWQAFNERLFKTRTQQEAIELAVKDIEKWLGRDGVAGRTVLDIGCGTGLHSLAFLLLGATRVLSIDVDVHSIAATKFFCREFGTPANWEIKQGSILNENFIFNLGRFDIVYAWGVLHHTGAMWNALDNCTKLIADNGKLWLSLYTAGPNYASHLALKRRYNAANDLQKRLMVARIIARRMLNRALSGRNPFTWNEKKARGMNSYHDLLDWLGGLPYEVASKKEVEAFCRKHGLRLVRDEPRGEGACSIYLFSR
ncbi:MAG: class I SAM-dependent methyltransferase [candidate division KSB1 bacterium]|nr:class I SAM-dependent methyltransferase [candidate division KSB1 bacterium]MDZ7276104.1 class I SAM-dependent methyltransferase [candidate division KSB1 bacterium]MDZ7287116.1 class I SAM-dependent methyltransferase [candidate division KSB1 bacterium]MDZ7296959.1 class I SAM-dependent methyltransferase [candidate division KSB1 bacterium]MDZ7307149.1 class I SAM-dependent methyltransferase [candidate division KSB1 bacterium]